MNRTRAFVLVSALLAASASGASLPGGARYVAMGSSYASGPGVTHAADSRDPRCARSHDNYAQQVARALKLNLVDVTCSGATTKNVVEAWNEVPAQIDALTADTALVTVTIGGNDLGYVGRLFAGSCSQATAETASVKAVCTAMRARAGAAGATLAAAPDAASWQAAKAGLLSIAAEVHKRAPRARLVFVEYLGVVPDSKSCATVPLSPAAAKVARETADRLARLTEEVAKGSRVEVLSMAKLSRQHGACAAEPWVSGFVPATAGAPFVPYHPNLAGMTAVATALIAKLR